MAENTAPFRNITRKDHPLKISPVSIGAVRSSMIPPAYRPRRLPRFSNYIIMPMAYLCNTFFSTEKLPGFVGKFVSALPLSQTSHLMRSISSGEAVNYTGIGILLLYLLVFTVAASWFIYKKKNL